MDARLEVDEVLHSVDQPSCKRSRQSHMCSKFMPPGCATLSCILQARTHLACKTTALLEPLLYLRVLFVTFSFLGKKKRKPVLASSTLLLRASSFTPQGATPRKGRPRCCRASAAYRGDATMSRAHPHRMVRGYRVRQTPVPPVPGGTRHRWKGKFNTCITVLCQ